jgi:hypothetical protein
MIHMLLLFGKNYGSSKLKHPRIKPTINGFLVISFLLNPMFQLI